MKIADLIARGEAFEGRDVPLRAAKLEALGVLPRHQGKVVATNAGVILFGQAATRRRCFGEARVDGARFAGANRSQLEPDCAAWRRQDCA
ncbi:MAG: hypothetical protein ACYCU0_08720 [Solirubrobacteraceae bacterium]